MSILILSDAWDPHADRVSAILDSRGIRSFRLNLDVESLRDTNFFIEDDVATIFTPSDSFVSSEIETVWARRLNVAMSLQQEHLEDGASFQIWRNEWNRHLYWIFDTLRGASWLNPLLEGGVADNKHRQMRMAKQVGLSVPATLSGNRRSDLVRFSEEYGSVALKFISQKTVYRDGKFLGLYVHRLSCHDMEEFGGSDEQPVVLQAYIQKDYEVRYTVVGDEHFACKIESQKSPRASVDWRRYDVGNTPHEQMEAPSSIRKKVTMLMADLGIRYGAFDFIVDSEGTWWFLEVNSNGQWLWIQELAGLPIAEAIATLLASDRRK